MSENDKKVINDIWESNKKINIQLKMQFREDALKARITEYRFPLME